MGNMSYCRFHNTLHDLRDCNDHMGDEDISDAEIRERLSLIQLCQEIYEEYGWELEEDDQEEEAGGIT